MKLSCFLAAADPPLSYKSFGRQIGVSAQAVHRYAKEGRVPSAKVMRDIIAVTAGKVQSNDFFEPASPPTPRRRPAADAHAEVR